MLDMPGGLMIPNGNNMLTTSAAAIATLNNNGGGFAGYLGQNMMDGQHELPMLQQQQHDELPMLQQQQQLQQAAASESDARGPRQHDESGGSDNPEGGEDMPEEEDDGDDELGQQRRPRKKRYHRHTLQQIQALESFFKEVPHPDDKQRKELSQELGLEPLQVKFWFQNKRTQVKTQQERLENAQLRAENEKLRAENASYRAALANAGCPTCGGGGGGPAGEMSFQEHSLRMENARLRDEIDRVSAIAAKYLPNPSGVGSSAAAAGSSSGAAAAAAAAGAPYPPVPLGSHHLMPGADGMFGGIHHGAAAAARFDKTPVVELVVAAMEELVRMAQLGEPLWLPAVVEGAATEVLNEEEYARSFPSGVGPKSPEHHSEASRYTVVVIMNHTHLVEMFMDVNQWSMLFPTIVSRAGTIEVLSTGVAGNYNGAMQLMTAEFQMPSPLVPTREGQFVRYCKQQGDGSWAVVDVSLDGGSGGPAEGASWRRRPSGCLIQEMPSGYSRVTWVEHAEADVAMVHELYRPLVSSGLAFGARRWAAALERQCERLASAMVSLGPATGGVVTSPEARRCMLRLAERMVASFCGGLAASPTHQWTTLTGSAPGVEVRVMTHKSVADPGRPSGVLLYAAASVWLPAPPARLFAFLHKDASRREWDVLSNGGGVQEMAHIANGRDHGNAASLLRVDNPNSSQSNMLILQECCTDAMGSYVVYAPVDVEAMTVVLSGGDPDFVALLPSGFAVLPDGPGAGDGGCILTVAFQILVDPEPTAKLSLSSVSTVDTLISTTVQRIRAALVPANGAAAAP